MTYRTKSDIKKLSLCYPTVKTARSYYYYLRQRRSKCFCPCLSVFLTVCLQDYSKTRAWIWMKCCMSTDIGTWTNLLIFVPYPDYSPDTGTGLLSLISYKCCNAEFYYVGKISRIRIGRPSLQRRVVLKWFYSPRAVGTTLSEVHALCRVPF